ncbi:MAG: hypothetical protein RL582_665 [Bacteroidota bacterium]|jgi:nucleotide-binding universal stress UspA family protein
MKTIFIATDFSEYAQRAADFAVDLASYMGCSIVLFHAYEVPLSIPDSFVLVEPEEVRKTAESYLLEESNRLRKSPLQPIEIIAVEGAPVPTILDQVKKYKEPLIVVGRTGMGGMLKNWFGTTASGLAKKTSLPVLLIPESIPFKPFQNAMLAAEIDIETPLDGISPLIDLCSRCHTNLDVVRVLKPYVNFVAELSYRSSRLAGRLNGLNWNYAFPRGEDVFETLNEYALSNEVDLLAVIPQHHSFLDRIFNKSESKMLIRHTHIPLLLLPENTAYQKMPTPKLQEQQS